jgi:hypothetical protein
MEGCSYLIFDYFIFLRCYFFGLEMLDGRNFFYFYFVNGYFFSDENFFIFFCCGDGIYYFLSFVVGFYF